MFKRTVKILVAATAIGAVGCGEEAVNDVASSEGAVLGDALPGTNAATFTAARANFAASENNTDGLGPIFNEHSCGACHSEGAVGGAGQNIERRYGKLTGGVFDPMADTGGSLRQLFGIGGFNVGGLNCNSGTDANPAPGATIFAGRLTTPLFGLGLVDSLPDSRFDTLASREPSGIRGIVNRVSIALPNPADASQRVGGTRVGRFGWKAGVPALSQFSADAYVNEMGITTSSCSSGVPNLAFATENRANRAPSNAVINGCPDDAVPGTDDDFAEETNNCAGGVNDLQDDVKNFTFFMAHLAAPAPLAITAGTAQDRGRTLFNSAALQCSGCHRSDSDVFVSTTAGGIQGGIVFAPFSDFLLHDMGTLGDGIGNAGDSVAVTHRMRTAPLWGLRSRNNLMHDGRTTDRGAAIQAHNGGTTGQGTAAANAYNALTSAQKSDLLAFLATL
ncbi:MAG TPA: di-heme oxidoredictase family protein [Burkholderiaceae bacterium]|nr:di-heme oxidoredictase family protein [Burkholderiaceae bacterium]